MFGILFFVVGVIVGGGAVIVFGKNNKRKIEAMRQEMIDMYDKVDDSLKEKIDEILKS